MKKGLKRVAFCMALAMGLSGCGSASEELRPDPSMVLNIETAESIVSNGQLGKPWTQATFVTNLLYRTLFQATVGELAVEPDLVDTYDISDDGLVYELKLRDDTLWSDGEVLDVDDVVFSIESFLIIGQTQFVNNICTTAFTDIVGYDDFIENRADGLKGLSVEGNTITITLNNPNNLFLQSLAQFAIFPEHAFEEFEVEQFFATDLAYWDNPVVSGMYKLGEHIVDESITLVYNEHYGETLPYIHSVVLRSDFENEELSYYETNDVSKILDYRAIKNQGEYDVNSVFYRYFIFNIDKDGEIDPVLSDERVRRAFMYAIDREALVKNVYYGIGTVNNSPIVQEYNQAIEIDYDYDPEKAKELLAEANYDFDRPVTLLYYYTDDISIKFMEECVKQLEAIGLKVELIKSNWLTNNEYDIALKGLPVFSIEDWYNEYLSSSQIYQEVFGGEPLFDELIIELRQAKTQEERNEVLVALQELEYDTFYKYPLFIMGHKVYLRDDVSIPDTVVFGNSNYKYDLDFEEWKINASN